MPCAYYTGKACRVFSGLKLDDEMKCLCEGDFAKCTRYQFKEKGTVRKKEISEK